MAVVAIRRPSSTRLGSTQDAACLLASPRFSLLPYKAGPAGRQSPHLDRFACQRCWPSPRPHRCARTHTHTEKCAQHRHTCRPPHPIAAARCRRRRQGARRLMRACISAADRPPRRRLATLPLGSTLRAAAQRLHTRSCRHASGRHSISTSTSTSSILGRGRGRRSRMAIMAPDQAAASR